MATRFTIRENTWEYQLFRARVVWSFAFVGALALVICARMLHLQVLEFQHFETLSEDNRVKVVPVAPTRGLVFDRNGVLLAQNTPTHSLELTPESVGDLDAVIEELKTVVAIEDSDIARFHALRRRKLRFESVPLRFRLSAQEIARFAVNRHRFPGVDVHARLAREYPLGARGVHFIGYVGRINERELKSIDVSDYRGSTHIGKTGIEQAFEDDLHGTVGYRHVETNAQGRVLRELNRHPPVPGSNIYLTLDIRLQAIAERALGAENGAVVAIEPATGDVLAFASNPSFDPNPFVDGIEPKAYRALLESENRPLFNRVINGRYPPGSTIKPFVALAGLEYDVDQVRRESKCHGFFRLPKHRHRYRDWKKGGHGRVSLTRGIVESCDVYFYELSLALGIDHMHEFLTRFGFGGNTGIDLQGESTGLFPSREWKRAARDQPWYPGETLITGIGQGFVLTTPLQLASATATLATRGIRLKPKVVSRIVDPQREEAVPATVAIAGIATDSDAHWRTVVSAMEDVVHGKRGTARQTGLDLSFRMAGKTGTAQVINVAQDEDYDEEKLEKKYRDHGLFIAFAPVDSPQIAVAVVVENGGSGSRSAAPVAREVIEFYLDGPAGPEAEDPDNLLLTDDAPETPGGATAPPTPARTLRGHEGIGVSASLL